MQALVDLNRVGNNQNQIARALNELLLSRTSRAAAASKFCGGIGGRDPWLARCFAAPLAAILAALSRDREG